MTKVNLQKDQGLFPAIVQDNGTGQILMLGYMTPEALQRTLQERKVWFFSRSRQCLWMKGEQSGNELLVKTIYTDCDQDAILIKAAPQGPTCHTGKTSCFFTMLLNEEVSS